MSSLPSAIIFINGDITYPAEPPPYPPSSDVFIGSIPNNPRSYITSPSELNTLQNQLFIDDTMTKYEFDRRMWEDPNYATVVHLQGMRILVILPTFQDYLYRDLADITLFLHQGLADVLTNRFWHREEPEVIVHTYPQTCPDFPDEEPRHGVAVGPPGKCYELQRLTIYELIRASHSCSSNGDITVPDEALGQNCQKCLYPFRCDRCHTFSGIKICNSCCGECKCGCDTGLISNQGVPISPIHLPNCDKEANNYAFTHRK
jgi:hypothetical protein